MAKTKLLGLNTDWQAVKEKNEYYHIFQKGKMNPIAWVAMSEFSEANAETIARCPQMARVIRNAWRTLGAIAERGELGETLSKIHGQLDDIMQEIGDYI